MRRSPLYEVVGQLGMWGMIINAIQAAGLEHKAMREATWSGMNSELLFYIVSCHALISLSSRPPRRVYRFDVHSLHRRAATLPHGLFCVL